MAPCSKAIEHEQLLAFLFSTKTVLTSSHSVHKQHEKSSCRGTAFLLLCGVGECCVSRITLLIGCVPELFENTFYIVSDHGVMNFNEIRWFLVNGNHYQVVTADPHVCCEFDI